MIEDSERRAAAAARGEEEAPMPVWDAVKGDLARNPDGSFLMSDRARFDPKTGLLLRNRDGSYVVGEPVSRSCRTSEGCPR
jgi:hypothetical protein